MSSYSANRNSATRTVEFLALDAVALTGTWYFPGRLEAQNHIIVIAPGGGIPARSYARFARYLANRGFPAFTFDYRGIGGSRTGTLVGLEADTAIWGQKDLGGALAHARAQFPDASLDVVTHSISALILGAAPGADKISRAVFFAPHTAFWRDYGRRWRWLLYLTWHVLMPTVTLWAGYFPGRKLGLGQDLPKGFALEWGGRRTPDILSSSRNRDKWSAILADYDRFTAQTLAISVTDDAFAPPDAAKRLIAEYPNISAICHAVRPCDLGCKRLGHMAFLREDTGPYFWQRATAWLLPAEAVGRASDRGALDDVPPSGTKDGAPAGSAASST